MAKPATDIIVKQQEEAKRSLPFADTQDFADATRNLIAPLKPVDARVWDVNWYDFLNGDAPDTANPSLWRQCQLANIGGLFQVAEGIYQVRGLDISNTTFIEGDEGVIVIDPLKSRETGAAALQLYRDHRGPRQIKAVIYTHPHVDHFGGVKGMVTQEDVDAGLPIIAPVGFLEHAVSENVFAGTAMGRRAAYMYGAIPRGPQGQIGCGLGQAVSRGEVTLIAPTDSIETTGETRTIDGVTMEFQMAPDTEAPCELLIYFPRQRALCAAEDATHTFHNLGTLRGALVRDAHGWAKYLTEAIDLFANRTDVVFASHHWPTWGAANVRRFLSVQRDLYAYVHDQTLRMLNQGYTGPEIAEKMRLPPALETWSTRGYYGSLSHNVKAIYQRYMGWFDGNPAHLWEHTPEERSKRYVDLIGVDKAVAAGEAAFKEGDYRWAAEILNHVVFADPSNPARELLADTYEQLGYGAENATWRNFYLSGAAELRSGKFGAATAASPDVISQLTPEMLFDALAIQINGPAAWDVQFSMDVVTDTTYRVWLSNGALLYTKAPQTNDADVRITATNRSLTALAIYGLDPEQLEKAGIVLEGDIGALRRLRALLDPGDRNFNIVTP
ncbi:hypothetical protein A1Q1_07937 [Trichosporon asahii var. asahii CBS 2479]|uniref:Metallo-beta-lactamase domain-containing protein n=1 Tax=Trichosporon asahii var. asahii (strain ATCC 90039 / CBS 2479 / JCM 2466 / KCTC 7840 / NBRC 103889/ NCYC 2677 / UAMH 7654) TaxID=1186058 RepID=J4UH55_TRIAS|nr:hypothetical protein A1Q1_07937 [Trichosporon asahii var. asahii CBS 2479]EJT50875.1 hypothetical protein A1Q1_07937 [Trichosporon asahii var. asahii CBS 2479]